jgi:hypothetical protein
MAKIHLDDRLGVSTRPEYLLLKYANRHARALVRGILGSLTKDR